tara:strand:+ start:1120 stop:1269 length:150 start_codon:yes stop_codon:yes gene_type:complete
VLQTYLGVHVVVTLTGQQAVDNQVLVHIAVIGQNVVVADQVKVDLVLSE